MKSLEKNYPFLIKKIQVTEPRLSGADFNLFLGEYTKKVVTSRSGISATIFNPVHERVRINYYICRVSITKPLLLLNKGEYTLQDVVIDNESNDQNIRTITETLFLN